MEGLKGFGNALLIVNFSAFNLISAPSSPDMLNVIKVLLPVAPLSSVADTSISTKPEKFSGA